MSLTGATVPTETSEASAHTPVDIASIPLQVPVTSAPAASIELSSAPVLIRTSAVEAPAFDAEPAPAPIVVRAAETAKPDIPQPSLRPRNPPALPPAQLALPADSGLELVETRTHTAEPLVEQEAPRAKRARPQRAVIADEPLQMVETRHDDKPAA
jgi:hypothetical protein